MNPNEVTAWITVAQVLASAGVQIAGKFKDMLGLARPDLSPEELKDAYDAIIADDTVRAAFAVQAAGGGQ